MRVLRRDELPVVEAQNVFRVQITMPRADGVRNGFGPLLAIHRAFFDVGAVVPMHEHREDEILSYVVAGTLLHEDSAGNTESISSGRVMMMNAGRGLWHEESAPASAVEMLQVFFMPGEPDREGEVQFHDRPPAAAGSGWTPLAGHEEAGAPVAIRQRAAVYEAVLDDSSDLELPVVDGMSPCLYVVDGDVVVDGSALAAGETAYAVESKGSRLSARTRARVMLLMVDLAAPVVRGSAWARHQRIRAAEQAGRGR